MASFLVGEATVDAFIFDMDGTLFGYDDVVASINSEHKVMEEICAHSTSALRIEDLSTMFKEAFDVDRRKWFRGVIGALGWPDDDASDQFAVDLEHFYWLTFGSYNVPYDDGIHFIEAIAPHVRIGMITDGYRFNQKSKLYSSGLNRYFPVGSVVFSDDVGVMKPNERIFRHALEKFETTPERTVYIGDKIHKDVRGANSVGMVSILLRRGYNAFEPIVEDGDNRTSKCVPSTSSCGAASLDDCHCWRDDL